MKKIITIKKYSLQFIFYLEKQEKNKRLGKDYQ